MTHEERDELRVARLVRLRAARARRLAWTRSQAKVGACLVPHCGYVFRTRSEAAAVAAIKAHTLARHADDVEVTFASLLYPQPPQ